jgi:hypothetical protein
VIAIAGLEIVAGGASAPPALNTPHSSPRTTTDGFPGEEARHGQTP